MIFHVLAITFNTKTRFWNYEMTCFNAVFIYLIIILTTIMILQEIILLRDELMFKIT